MSQSEYQGSGSVSEEDYEAEQKPRQRLRPGNRAKSYQAMHREPKTQVQKRQTRGRQGRILMDSNEQEIIEPRKTYNYADELQGDQDDQGQQAEEDDQYSIFNVQIAQFLWRRVRQSTGEEEYLVKFRGRSYLHVEWMTEPQIQALGKSMKNKINRFNKTFNLKIADGNYDEQAIDQQKYFDPSYLEVDRILMATQMFPIIHQKKANQIKGKWNQSLMIVCSKLLNFTKNFMNYGVLFCEPVDPQRDNVPDYLKIISHPMDLGTIMNKIYLDIYKKNQQFWHDIGLVWKNCLKFNSEQTSDLHVLGLTLRECTIFLYDQWFHLSEQRYQNLKKELGDTFMVEQKKEFDQTIKEQPIQQEEKNQENKNGNIQEHEVQKNNQKHKENIPQNGLQYQNNSIEKTKQKHQNGQLKKIKDQNEKQPSSGEIEKQQDQFQSDEELQVQEEKKKSSSSSSSSQEQQKQKMDQEDDDSKEFLNMDQFYSKNIFLTQKKVQNPQCLEELEILNPGQFSYKWLTDSEEEAAKFLAHNYNEIDLHDMKKLDLNVQVNRLFLVKWKNLSYSQATWELQTTIACPQKINEFKHINKALGKQARTAMDQQKQKHKILVDLQFNPKKRSRYTSNFQLNDIKNKLYFYDVGAKKDPPQYKIQDQPVYKNYKLLREYQLESLNWLIKSWYEKRNIILADEMGLGKTIQSIAFLFHLFSVENVKGPFLVIAPLSTLEHWKRTVQEWTSMNCVLYYDQNGQPGRRSIQYYQWYHTNITMKGSSVQSELNKFQVLITSYEVFLLDFADVIVNIPFQFVVVDEAHRLKNKNAKILATLKKLPCKRSLLLTGTPVQNNTGQLWSLLNYIHPEKFASSQDFKRQFGDLSSNQQVQKLNRVLKPYMLRRMKEDVEQSIPPLQETIIDVQMTNMQKTIYRALYEKNKGMLIKGLSSTGTCNTNLNNLQIQLRKCCNHPFLIKQIEYDLLKDIQTFQQKIDKLISSSGKMVLVKKLLQKCKKEGKKVLIFSQFTHMLQLIQDFLKFKQYKYERIDGQIKAKQRQSAIDRYNNPHKKRDVFLLSTKAGGVGINLTSANVVIIYDSDWNPQNDVQATARAHRIGQKSQVQVYRLVTCNTYQTQMFERATQKLGLDKAIFISGSFKQTGQSISENKLTKNQMETLLKKGILGFIQNQQEDQNQDPQAFFEQNVEDIIQKNSRIAKYSMVSGSCTFSKRRFVSENSDNQLKINDPNFWNIVLKNVESQTQQLLKKVKKIENYKSLQAQKKLMLEASELMNTTIQNKLNLTGFNADDQINLSQFLTIVNSQRTFHKHYRDLASQWLEEICKPSRRFKKFTFQDLQIPQKGAKKPAVKSSSMKPNQDEDNDNIFGQQEQQEEQSQSQDKVKLSDLKKQEYLKRLCTVCEKPKCTFYCKGYCKRAFHQECRKKAEQLDFQFTDADYEGFSKIDIKQMSIDNQNLKVIADMNYLCTDCQNNTVQCLICKGKGSYYGAEYKKSKKQGKQGKEGKEKSKSGKDSNNQDAIVQEGQTSGKNSKRKNQLTKCSTANCAKFFHPKCVQAYDTKKLFKYIDANSMHFRCSLHYCNVCGVSGDTMSIYQCVRCPKALHTKCMDKQKIVKVSKKQFICDNHFKNKKQLKKAQERLQPIPVAGTLKKFLKAQKTQQKKKEKKVYVAPIVQQEQEKEENQILHNYSTRRNKVSGNSFLTQKEKNSNFQDEEISDQPIMKSQKTGFKNKIKLQLLTYQQLGMKPITQFDYEHYDQDWCRYCGSRYSSNFTQGPWGSKTLCTVHYINWKQNRTLKLDAYVQKPTTPIDPKNDQQLKFITGFANKHTQKSFKQIVQMLQNKKNPKKDKSLGELEGLEN